MNIRIDKLHPLAFALIFAFAGCATGEDKNEGTTEEPQPSVGTTFEQNEQSTTTGTAPAGDTVGVHTNTITNDQVGPTDDEQGADDQPEAPAY